MCHASSIHSNFSLPEQSLLACNLRVGLGARVQANEQRPSTLLASVWLSSSVYKKGQPLCLCVCVLYAWNLSIDALVALPLPLPLQYMQILSLPCSKSAWQLFAWSFFLRPKCALLKLVLLHRPAALAGQADDCLICIAH